MFLSNRWNRIIPAAFLMYTIAYIDRTNFSLAIPYLRKEFSLSAGEAALASGIFFAGYVLFQIPGGYMAQKWSAKRVIFWSMLVWGTAATLCGFAGSLQELLVYRFLLGVGEGGVWPATIVLLANWFVPQERARANGYWVLCQPAAIITSSPLSGWLLDHSDWRMMFIVQGLLPIFFAFVWWWAVEDKPSLAKWTRDPDVPPFPESSSTTSEARPSQWEFLRDRNVLTFLVLNLAFGCGAYGLLIWLPSAIRSLGVENNLLIGILTAMPYVFAGFGAVLNSRLSDRARERRWHAATPCVIAGLALICGFLLSSRVPALGLLLLCTTGAGIYATLGPKWALMTEILPRRTAGVALGLVNGVGNIGGFLGPYAVGALHDSTQSFAAGFVFLSLCLIVSGIMMLLVAKPGQRVLEAAAEHANLRA
jgi:MFS family permease